MVGVDGLFAENAIAPCETIVQVPAPRESAEMMRVSDFRHEIACHDALRVLVGRFVVALHAQTIRLTACNARHDVLARCARWLLTAHNHMHGRDFHLSQEFLGVMLGVRRQSVSSVAAMLQHSGLVRYSHGHVTILNAPALETLACECYGAIRTIYSQV